MGRKFLCINISSSFPLGRLNHLFLLPLRLFLLFFLFSFENILKHFTIEKYFENRCFDHSVCFHVTTERSSKCQEVLKYQVPSLALDIFRVQIYSFLSKWSHVCVRVCAKSLQSCLTLCDPVDCSLPGCSAHGIFQAGILQWVAISYSRGFSQPRD